MKGLYFQLRKALILCSVFVIYSLVFVREAGAPPPPPPPPPSPAVPVGGALAQAVVIGAMAAYGAWRVFRKK
ncbi:MAG: hypothetical protein ACE5IH_05250 [Thermodesulfobacteriota bacterium]